MPPYITNEGKIYERLSSGSYPIKDSIKLGQLFHRKTDQIIKIKNKIELDDIMIDKNFPDNLCGYLDLGFSLDCYYKIGDGDREEDKNVFSGYWEAHCDRYGNNLIIESSRVPKNDYLIIDRRSLEEKKIKYNTTNIVGQLFLSGLFN